MSTTINLHPWFSWVAICIWPENPAPKGMMFVTSNLNRWQVLGWFQCKIGTAIVSSWKIAVGWVANILKIFADFRSNVGSWSGLLGVKNHIGNLPQTLNYSSEGCTAFLLILFWCNSLFSLHHHIIPLSLLARAKRYPVASRKPACTKSGCLQWCESRSLKLSSR